VLGSTGNVVSACSTAFLPSSLCLLRFIRSSLTKSRPAIVNRIFSFRAYDPHPYTGPDAKFTSRDSVIEVFGCTRCQELSLRRGTLILGKKVQIAHWRRRIVRLQQIIPSSLAWGLMLSIGVHEFHDLRIEVEFPVPTFLITGVLSRSGKIRAWPIACYQGRLKNGLKVYAPVIGGRVVRLSVQRVNVTSSLLNTISILTRTMSFQLPRVVPSAYRSACFSAESPSKTLRWSYPKNLKVCCIARRCYHPSSHLRSEAVASSSDSSCLYQTSITRKGSN
jgi:hypothetical protein